MKKISAGLAFGLPSEAEPSKKVEKLPPVEAGKASPIPTLRKFPRAAVASDGEHTAKNVTIRGKIFILEPILFNASGLPCATVAKELLAEGGSAVDAAVGALVCNGLYNPQVPIN